MLHRRRGFTLAEVLTAVTVLALAAVLVQGTFRTLMFSLEAARSEAELSRTAEGIMWVFSEELYNAVFAGGLEFSGAGDEGEPAIVFWTARARPGTGEKGLYRVSYAQEEEYLWKGVDDYSFRAASGIQGFSVAFYDGQEWLEAWDSAAQGGLPRAARVQIEIGGREFVKTCLIPAN